MPIPTNYGRIVRSISKVAALPDMRSLNTLLHTGYSSQE